VPRLIIRAAGGEVVYEGEGEIQLSSDYSFGEPDRPRIEIHRQERRGDEMRGMVLDITEFLRTLSPDYSIQRNPLAVPVPQPLRGTTQLSLSLPAGSLGWLRQALAAPLDTPEERAERAQRREAAMRLYQRQVQPVSQAHIAEAFGLPGEVVFSQDDVNRATPQVGGYGIGRDHGLDELLGYWRGRARAALPAPLMSFREALESFGRSAELAQQGIASLAEIQRRSAEHEEVIRSAEAELPYDPLGYGRIYPGDAGTSRWTPPEDPDEKIRSCP